jgi:hypothetical protein
VKTWLALAVAIPLVAGVPVGATPERVAACAAPKPLPASLKRPPSGASATQLANFLLALPQRKPCDVNRFTSKFFDGQIGLYPEGRPMREVPRTAAPTEGQVRPRLVAFLAGSTGGATALRLFDGVELKAKVPDPTLRASLVSLHGTAAEPVIGFFLRTAYAAPPRFGGLPVTTIGKSASLGSPRKQQVILNVRFQGDHFALLSGIFAHEILHHDDTPNIAEEVLLNALTAIVQTQLLARHPELAMLDTELSRNMNDYVLEFANSRLRGSPRSAILAPGGKGVAPGSTKNVPDFWTFFSRQYTGQIRGGVPDALPAPPVFVTVLRRLLGPGTAPKAIFDRATAERFARMSDTWMAPFDRLRVSLLLGLVSMEEIVKYTGLKRPKAVAMFRLAPILAAMK